MRVGEGWGRGLGIGAPKVLDGLQLNDWKQCPSPMWSPDSALQEGVLTISLSTAAVSVLLSGVPCPIVIAWAIGKLYYENEQ